MVPSAEEFSLSDAQVREITGLTSAVRVFTGYGTVLFVAPRNTRYDTRVQDGHVPNGGNATVVLDNLRYCERSSPDRHARHHRPCRPGRTYALQADDSRFARYDLREGDDHHSIDCAADRPPISPFCNVPTGFARRPAGRLCLRPGVVSHRIHPPIPEHFHVPEVRPGCSRCSPHRTGCQPGSHRIKSITVNVTADVPNTAGLQVYA